MSRLKALPISVTPANTGNPTRQPALEHNRVPRVASAVLQNNPHPLCEIVAAVVNRLICLATNQSVFVLCSTYQLGLVALTSGSQDPDISLLQGRTFNPRERKATTGAPSSQPNPAADSKHLRHPGNPSTARHPRTASDVALRYLAGARQRRCAATRSSRPQRLPHGQNRQF